jgi:hypothetical protein
MRLEFSAVVYLPANIGISQSSFPEILRLYPNTPARFSYKDARRSVVAAGGATLLRAAVQDAHPVRLAMGGEGVFMPPCLFFY